MVATVFERTFSYGFTVDARQCHKCHRLVAENLIHCGIDLRTQEDVILMHQMATQNEGQKALIGAIITKTDEAAQIGPVVDCLIRHKLPLMFLANGQRVPEDLSQANTAYLSHRALHPRSISGRMDIPDEQISMHLMDQLNDWIKNS